MSGIVGLFNLDGARVESELLHRLTVSMAAQGPDAQNSWHAGPVGFGKTVLTTSRRTGGEAAPFSLDGQSWVVADARLDDRETLLASLQLSGQPDAANHSPTELIWRSYERWGEECVAHLSGDFAFMVWDGRRQRLFGARDQFGVKPFYYAHLGQALLVSNSLNCLRRHPLVSNELNEAAIADFLLFNLNYNLETTTFADIQRLPGGHSLIAENGRVRTQRYWTLPMPDRQIRYRRESEYVEHFREVMGRAIADRLDNQDEKVALLYSGGLDSNTLASLALQLKQKGQALDLQGFTFFDKELGADHEPDFARIGAAALGLPLQLTALAQTELYEAQADLPALATPEPNNDPLALALYASNQLIAQHSRVCLAGHVGDEVFRRSSLESVLKTTAPLNFLADLWSSLALHHFYPFTAPSAVMRDLLRKAGKQSKPALVPARTVPAWLQADFVARLGLADRYREVQNSLQIHRLDPNLPRAYHNLLNRNWSTMFERDDPGATGLLLEHRLPFLDLRVIAFALALPRIPWCVNKELLRVSLRDYVPPAIYRRPKTPLSGSPIFEKIQNGQRPWQELSRMPLVEAFVDTQKVAALESIARITAVNDLEILRPVSLGYWLQAQSYPYSSSTNPDFLSKNHLLATSYQESFS